MVPAVRELDRRAAPPSDAVRAPWKTRESVELPTLEWVAWYKNCRLVVRLGYIPPAEAEANYYRQLINAADVPALT